MLGESHGGLYKAPTKEERRMQKANRRKRDQIKFIDLRFERWQVVRFRKKVRRSINCMFLQWMMNKYIAVHSHTFPTYISIHSYKQPCMHSCIFLDQSELDEKDAVKFRDQVEKLQKQAGESWLTFYNEMQSEDGQSLPTVILPFRQS